MSVHSVLIRRPDDLNPQWLANALGSGAVASFDVARIGTGQMSENYRVSLAYQDGDESGPSSVIAKFASADSTSRETGVRLGAYEREVRFYQQLARRIGGPLSVCHAAAFDPQEGWFTLLLEDVAPAMQGDQIAGCTPDEAALAMRALAQVHAPVFGDPHLGATAWLNQPWPLNQALLTQLLPGFLERYGDRIAPEHRELCERFVPHVDAWLADRKPPLGLVHGDYRLDNVLFGESGSPKPLTIVDWQTVSWGPPMLDASYFLGAGLQIEDRRAHEENLVRVYHEELQAGGVQGFSWGECWTGYRHQVFAGLSMAIAAPMLVERTERGDEMFMAMLSRHAQQAIDLEALDLLPEPRAGRPAALRPDPADEGRHAASAEQLWNESWYFDAVAEDGSIGAYVRLGMYPNQGVSWYTAFVCGPGRPSIAIVDFEAPVPDGEALAVPTAKGDAQLRCDAPLERFTVRFEGEGEAYDDPAAILRNEAGKPIPVALDLVWETLGEPYAYRFTTRYEIPCRVSGTLRVGDEQLELRAVGQRDHSWGTRDWWGMDWVWSAGHLADGTRFHGGEFRLRGAPPVSVGYVQPPEGGVTEPDAVVATEEIGSDGLITTASIDFQPGLPLKVEPLAWGPLRLVAPDGRVASFPRAMCRVHAGDGRSGVAWLEWNRNSGDGG